MAVPLTERFTHKGLRIATSVGMIATSLTLSAVRPTENHPDNYIPVSSILHENEQITIEHAIFPSPTPESNLPKTSQEILIDPYPIKDSEIEQRKDARSKGYYHDNLHIAANLYRVSHAYRWIEDLDYSSPNSVQ